MDSLHRLRSLACYTLLSVALAALAGSSHAETTYEYTGPFFNNVTGAYTTGDRVTGRFTTDLPLPPDLAFQDVSGLVSTFSFTDGHQTFTQDDVPGFFVFEFMLSTDGAGEIADWRITLIESGTVLMQTRSESGSHNDGGQFEVASLGSISGVRGAWTVEGAPAIPMLGVHARLTVLLVVAGSTIFVIRRQQATG